MIESLAPAGNVLDPAHRLGHQAPLSLGIHPTHVPTSIQPVKVEPSASPIPNQQGGGSQNGETNVTLWQFLLELLFSRKFDHVILWTGKCDGEFKLLDAEQVARLWGVRKNKPHMNYDKLSRALRYYYDKNIIRKVVGQKFVYRFVSFPEGAAASAQMVQYAAQMGVPVQCGGPMGQAVVPDRVTRCTSRSPTATSVGSSGSSSNSAPSANQSHILSANPRQGTSVGAELTVPGAQVTIGQNGVPVGLWTHRTPDQSPSSQVQNSIANEPKLCTTPHTQTSRQSSAFSAYSATSVGKANSVSVGKCDSASEGALGSPIDLSKNSTRHKALPQTSAVPVKRKQSPSLERDRKNRTPSDTESISGDRNMFHSGLQRCESDSATKRRLTDCGTSDHAASRKRPAKPRPLPLNLTNACQPCTSGTQQHSSNMIPTTPALLSAWLEACQSPVLQQWVRQATTQSPLFGELRTPTSTAQQLNAQIANQNVASMAAAFLSPPSSSSDAKLAPGATHFQFPPPADLECHQPSNNSPLCPIPISPFGHLSLHFSPAANMSNIMAAGASLNNASDAQLPNAYRGRRPSNSLDISTSGAGVNLGVHRGNLAV